MPRLVGAASRAALPTLSQACTQVRTGGGTDMVLRVHDSARRVGGEIDLAPLVQALVRTCGAQADYVAVDCADTLPLHAVQRAAGRSVRGALYANLTHVGSEASFANCSAPLLSAYVVVQAQPSANRGLTAGQIGLIVILSVASAAVVGVILHTCWSRSRLRPSRHYSNTTAYPFAHANAQSAQRVRFGADASRSGPAIPLRSYAGGRRQTAHNDALANAGLASGYAVGDGGGWGSGSGWGDAGGGGYGGGGDGGGGGGGGDGGGGGAC